MSPKTVRKSKRPIKPTFLDDWVKSALPRESNRSSALKRKTSESFNEKNNLSDKSTTTETTKRQSTRSSSNRSLDVESSNRQLVRSATKKSNKSLETTEPITPIRSASKRSNKSTNETPSSLLKSFVQSSNRTTRQESNKTNQTSKNALVVESLTNKKTPTTAKKNNKRKLSIKSVPSKKTTKLKEKLNKLSKSTGRKAALTTIRTVKKKLDKKLKLSSRKKVNVNDETEFKCSVCAQTFVRRNKANEHIIIEHYGLARLNSTDNDFSNKEILAGYKAAINLLKTIKCSKCNKSFTSALGLRFHDDICGKSQEELTERCELCGRSLKKVSMKSHLDMHRRKELRAENDEMKANEMNENDACKFLEGGNSNVKRPIRKSAKKANEFLKSTADESGSNYDDSEQETETTSKRKKKSKKLQEEEEYELSDYNMNDEDDETSQTSSHSSADSQNYQSIKNYLSIFKIQIPVDKKFYLYKLWRSHIKMPKKLSDTIEINQNKGNYNCSKCNQLFSNQDIYIYHSVKCDKTLDNGWSCNLCDLDGNEMSLVFLLKHLIDQHIAEIDGLSTQQIELMIPKPNKRELLTGFSASITKDTESFYRQHFNEPAFEEWMVDKKSISFLNKNELDHYLPERKQSPKFKFKTIQNNQQLTQQMSDWKTLNLFESLTSKHHITFYTGGPVYSGAWCPYPANSNLDQILCVSTNVKNRIYNVFDCNQYAGCLQFWNFGKLKIDQNSAGSSRNLNDDGTLKKPKLEFIIVHNYGTISEMTWCPGGTTYCPKTENSDGRLGLLALACTDGRIRILSVPLIEELDRLSSNDELKVIKLKPILITEKHPNGLSLFNKPTICKSLSWSPTDRQRYIVAGYGNGLISIFDLQTESSLLKKVLKSSNQIELKPKKSWIGHGACVNSVKWLPFTNCSYIISGGFDRYAKVWTLDDMVTNIVLPKKTIITNVHWSFKYIGCYLSSDDCFSNLHNSVNFRDLTTSNFSNSLSRHKSCVWDFDISNWTNTEAGVDAAGEAVLSVYVKPKNGKKYFKTRPYECLPIYHLSYESLEDENQSIISNDNHSNTSSSNEKAPIKYLIDRGKPIKSTIDDMINSYGLIFNDTDLTLYSKIPKTEFERLKVPDSMNYPRLGDYPLTSLNRVQFNPNKSSSNYVFTSGESGLSRVSYIELLKNPAFSINN